MNDWNNGKCKHWKTKFYISIRIISASADCLLCLKTLFTTFSYYFYSVFQDVESLVLAAFIWQRFCVRSRSSTAGSFYKKQTGRQSSCETLTSAWTSSETPESKEFQTGWRIPTAIWKLSSESIILSFTFCWKNSVLQYHFCLTLAWATATWLTTAVQSLHQASRQRRALSASWTCLAMTFKIREYTNSAWVSEAHYANLRCYRKLFISL